jgi:ubiquinol-cytochrome c reductase cytochrome c subunit
MSGRSGAGVRATIMATVLVVGGTTVVVSGAAAGDVPVEAAGVSGVAAPAQADPALVEEGAQVYADNCSTCHQAGGVGIPGSFPPLAGNPRAVDPDHVESVVREGLDEPIEVQGVTYTAAMQPVDLSADEITAVAAYVASLASGETTATPATTAPPIGPGDAVAGEDLFVGATTFANGGAACAGCHTAGSVGNLGGSSLGPDLSDSIARFGGAAGLIAWLGDPPSATMTPLFADRPLTDQEIADLVAFLTEAPDRSEPSYFGDVLVWLGLAGLVVLLAGMAVVWRGMRQTYVDKLRATGRPSRSGERDRSDEPMGAGV